MQATQRLRTYLLMVNYRSVKFLDQYEQVHDASVTRLFPLPERVWPARLSIILGYITLPALPKASCLLHYIQIHLTGLSSLL